MDNILKSGEDYWQVAQTIKNIYMSEGSLSTLIDFERVLDELDIFAFKNWELGELVSGPEIKKYSVTCVFMWPEKLMPDPRGGRRLLPFDCDINFKKTDIEVPTKIEDPSDYRPGTHKAKIVTKTVWLVEITIPKHLMSDIRTGSVEMEDDDIDLEDLDKAYEDDLQQEADQAQTGMDQSQQQQPDQLNPQLDQQNDQQPI